MRVRYFAWFDSKHERTEFINLLRSAKSDIDAVNKVSRINFIRSIWNSK